MNKFKLLGWEVSNGDFKKNRCPAHIRSERVPAPPKKPDPIAILFGTAPQEAKPKPDYTPREQKAAPVRDPGLHGPHTIKTKIIQQIGIDADLERIERRAVHMLKLMENNVRELNALLVTIHDAQKRIGAEVRS